MGSRTSHHFMRGIERQSTPNPSVFQKQAKTLFEIIACASFVALYCGFHHLAFFFNSADPIIPHISLQSGLSIGVLIVFGLSYWPLIAVSSLVSNVEAAGNSISLLGIMVGAVLRAVIAYKIILHIPKRPLLFTELSRAAQIILGSITGAFIGSLCCSSSVVFADMDLFQRFSSLVWSSFVASFSGFILFTPIFLAFFRKDFFPPKKSDFSPFAEVLQVTFIFGISSVFFLYCGSYSPILFFPFISIASLYVRQRILFLLIMTTAFCMIVGTWYGFGPFTTVEMRLNLALIQVFTGILSISAIILSSFQGSDPKTIQMAARTILIGGALSAVIVSVIRSEALSKDDLQFSFLVNNVEERIAVRMNTYADALLSGVNLFAALLSLVATAFIAALSSMQRKTEELVATKTSELEHSRDILQEKSVELMHARDSALIATEGKNKFLATMSHEIRTPLTSIIGYSQALSFGNLTRDEQNTAIRSIVHNGNYLAEVVNNILDLGKIEAGKMEMETLPVSLFEIFAEIEILMKDKALEKKLIFDTEYRFPLPKKIYTDPTRLKQILSNLLSNAIKFTEKGSVTLRASYRHRDKTMILEVQDTGIGLTKDQHEKLFQEFTQATLATARVAGGTGLGLVICKELVERLGGKISSESVFGRGTTFRVSLPMDEVHDTDLTFILPKIERKPVDILQTLPSIEGKILLVEDGDANRQLIQFMLRKTGLACVCIDNGEDAIEIALKENFNLILMDIQMRKMDGYTATRILRQKGFQKPIIAITANTLSGDREQCLQAGCTDYIAKPFEQSALLQMLTRHLSPGAEKESGKPKEVERITTTEALIQDDPEIYPLVILFLDQIPSELKMMQTLLEQGNSKEFIRLAHCLKGSAGNFRFNTLYEKAAELERIAKNGKYEEVREQLGMLKSSYEEALKEWNERKGGIEAFI